MVSHTIFRVCVLKAMNNKMTTRLCKVILVVVMWMQEIFQRHQEHLLNFIRIRLGLEVGVYKPYNWDL